MYKIYNFSQDKFLDKLTQIPHLDKFNIIENKKLTADELMIHKYDIIEFAPEDFSLFKPYVSAVDWKTNQIDMADCLILKNGTYQPLNLFSDAIINLIKKNSNKINSQLAVIVIGDFHFVFSVVTKLAISGFVQIIISLTDNDASYQEKIIKKLKSFIFNLNIRVININELTTSDIVGSLLISDFKKIENKDAYELLTYFNFLSQGALFIDCNSIVDNFLVEDARKAEVTVLDETEVIAHKYDYLLDLLKISPKV